MVSSFAVSRLKHTTCLHWVKSLNLNKGTTYRCGQLYGDQTGGWVTLKGLWYVIDRDAARPHLIYRYPWKNRETESNKLPELRAGQIRVDKGERWVEAINHVFTWFSFPHYCIYIRRHEVACLLGRVQQDVQWYGLWTSLLTVFTYPRFGSITGLRWGTKVSWLSLEWLYLSMHMTFTR